MAVDDLWYRTKRDPGTGERVPSKRHGRGKRWRVRWSDPETGEPQTEAFERKADAERHDAAMQADIHRGVYIDPRAGQVTVAEYAERWRFTLLHRGSTEYRTASALRRHVVPLLGKHRMSAVRASHLRGWVKDRSAHLAPSSLAMIYQTVVMPMFAAAVLDKVIGSTPCVGVRLPEVPDSEYYIARAEQVHAVAAALPELYRPVPYLAAGCGWRASEIFGLEVDAVDVDLLNVAVRQQLVAIAHREPCLGPPKTKTSHRVNEMEASLRDVLNGHLAAFPPSPTDITDETDPRAPRRREARLVFTREDGRPVTRKAWSRVWRPAVKAAGLPEGYGLRDLRHYFATVLIYGGANVKTVQIAMGHSTPMVTLNTYVGHWPDAVDETRGLVAAALGVCTRSVPGGGR